MIIDANNLILGRLASFAAKKALLGEEIEIINCENAVITGDKDYILVRFKREKSKSIQKGPYVPKRSDRFVKRVIKRMLPNKVARGREPLKRVMCYIGVPDNLKNEKAETLKNADISKTPNMKFMNVEKLCRLMGGK